MALPTERMFRKAVGRSWGKSLLLQTADQLQRWGLSQHAVGCVYEHAAEVVVQSVFLAVVALMRDCQHTSGMALGVSKWERANSGGCKGAVGDCSRKSFSNICSG
jgi:hypothetical protein